MQSDVQNASLELPFAFITLFSQASACLVFFSMSGTPHMLYVRGLVSDALGTTSIGMGILGSYVLDLITFSRVRSQWEASKICDCKNAALVPRL